MGPQLHRPPKDGAGSRCRFPCTGFPCAGSRVLGSRVPVPAPGTGSRFPIPGALGGRRERNFSGEEPATPFGLPVLPRFPVPVPGPPCLPPTRNGP